MLHSFPPTSAYVFFPLPCRLPSILFYPIYLERATLQIADNPISVGSPLSRDIGFRFRAVIPPLIPRMYTDETMCVKFRCYVI